MLWFDDWTMGVRVDVNTNVCRKPRSLKMEDHITAIVNSNYRIELTKKIFFYEQCIYILRILYICDKFFYLEH